MHSILNNTPEILNIILNYSNDLEINVLIYLLEKQWTDKLLNKSSLK